MAEKTNMKAVITNIQRFSLDDGDGIRTTVFFKGCPLSCLWCHNPECIRFQCELQYDSKQCKECGACVSACQFGAITTTKQNRVDRVKCTACGACTKVCVHTALKMVGSKYTVDTLLPLLLQDQPFYDNSGGGVTFSGGEPLAQPAFTAAVLKALKAKGVHTAVDTCGYFVDGAEDIARYTDLFLYDIKAADPILHKKLTGKSNDLVLKNFHMLTQTGARMRVRIPLVAGLNDRPGEMEAIARLLQGKSCVELVELLAYHGYGTAKYNLLGRGYSGNDFRPPSRERLDEIEQIFAKKNVQVRVRNH